MKNNITKFLVTGMLLLINFTGWAQEKFLKGQIQDLQGTAISHATVTLIGATNQVSYKSSVADEQGVYKWDNIKPGTYYIEAKSIGYETLRTEVLQLNDKSISLPTVQLKAAATKLAEVAIQGKKPLIQRKADMLVVNVEDSPLAAGSNALEILKQAPGVSVDNNENINLMGQAGVNVLINGKQTYLSAEQLNTLLKTTDGNAIKSVEIITSPSSKYDATGTAGIINIVLKKNKISGTNGTFNVTAAKSLKYRGNSSVSLNHKSEKTSYFMNYSFDKYNAKHDLSFIRNIPKTSGNNTVFDAVSDRNPDEHTHSFRAGADHNTSERNTIGFVVGGSFNKEKNYNSTLTNIFTKPSALDSTTNSVSDFRGSFNNITVNLNDQFNIDSNGRKLNVDLDYNRYKNTRHTDYNNSTFLPNNSLLGAPELLYSDMPTTIAIYVGKIDYTHPLSKKSKLEGGLKYAVVNTDNNLSFFEKVADSWEDIVNRTNHFVYKEKVAAAYASYSNQLGKWGINAGLRTEYTFSKGTNLTINNTVKRNYIDLFPTASVNFTPTEKHAFSLAYSKRIGRPDYTNLNPFESYIDKYTVQRGNPYLNPQYTNAYDFNYTLDQRYNFSLGYKKTNNEISETMGQDNLTNLTWITKANMATTQIAYLDFSAPINFTKKYTAFINATGVYVHFNGLLSGERYNSGSTLLQGQFNQNYKITDATAVHVNVRYNSAMRYSIYELHSKYAVDLGASHTFKDKRSTLKLGVSDIFKTYTNNLEVNFGDIKSDIKQYYDSRMLRLTYTYKFGNLSIKVKNKNASSEETNRVSK